MYRINKEKCTGCQACLTTCPGATIITGENKARIVDQDKLEECGGEKVCPFGAIEKINQEEKQAERVSPQPAPPTSLSPNTPLPEKGRFGMGKRLRQGRKGRGRHRRRN